MFLMFTTFFIILTICSLLSFVLIMFSKKYMKSIKKLTPFECGFNPLKNNRIPFSIHFFFISMIFLIFDVEITLILPMVLIYFKSNLMIWYSSCLYFFFLLNISLLYEWKKNMMNWTN
uniref:NADH-ubiquinone oxidoreductase chain 3 n=1 Tax=Oecetis caucula TaxID=2904905 RepID=A0A9E8LP36_9NEOP|nr:NADH dehydrogenase subunit 3 [Oecetis caucula]UZZ44214.1 NADH dehydrogenase subunit 3 [Oecetis caucula]